MERSKRYSFSISRAFKRIKEKEKAVNNTLLDWMVAKALIPWSPWPEVSSKQKKENVIEERRGRRGVIGQMMAGTELNKESNY